ncbi:MAG: flavin reductase [Clostridia bacterium]|nr:flavin reductase [Clostridia bacterium]
MKECAVNTIRENWIRAIADEWMLIAAGTAEGYNMMTASWGFAGEIWGEDSVLILVRPQRYTMEFLENNDTFTLSFYGENRAVHAVCGSKSGRDVDKTAETGLTPVFTDSSVYFAEARLVLQCRKQYMDHIRPESFLMSENLKKWYPNEDYHTVIVGKIERAWIKQ